MLSKAKQTKLHVLSGLALARPKARGAYCAALDRALEEVKDMPGGMERIERLTDLWLQHFNAEYGLHVGLYRPG